MADLKSPEAIYLVLAFLGPGIIVLFIRSQFITGRAPSAAESTITYLMLSIIYYTMVFPFVVYVIQAGGSVYWKLFLWLLLVFVGPTLFGLLLGLNVQNEWSRKLLQLVGLHSVHVVPTAWDWKFGSMGPQWVLVTLKDGTRFAGFCGADSFISSDPKERDLYVERVYDLDEQDRWHSRESSVLIAAGEIRTVEFWPYRPKEPTNGKQAEKSVTTAPQRVSEGLPAEANQ